MFELTGLIFAVVLFAITAHLASRSIFSPYDLFHTKNRNGAITSIIIGNVTLGTGLVYYVSLLNIGWVPAISVPIGVLTGYLLLSYCLQKSLYNADKHDSIYAYALNNDSSGGKYYFSAVVVIVPIMYVFLVAFEIFVSAPLVAVALGITPDSDVTIGLAVGIGTVGAIYAVIGGIRGVIYTDYIQIFLLFFMLGGLLFVSFFASKTSSSGEVIIENLDEIKIGISFNIESIVLALAAFATAVSTQFYNVINVGMGSNFDDKESSRLLRRSGFFLFTILCIVVLIGATLPNSENGENPIVNILQIIHNSTGIPFRIASFLIVMGMLGVMMSTIDSAVIHSGELIFEFFGNKSRSKDRNFGVKIAQLMIGSASFLSIGLFILFFNLQPDIIPLLLTIIFPLTMSAPIIAAGLLGKKKGYTSLLFNKHVETCVIFAIFGLWAIQIGEITTESGKNTPYITMTSWSLLIFLVVFQEIWQKISKK